MKDTIIKILRDSLALMGVEAPEIEIEIPKDPSFGDLSTPLAMGLARALRKPPRQIAKEIADNIDAGDVLDRIDIAGPGFLNFVFSHGFLLKGLRRVALGAIERPDIGKGQRVQVEFVSANPTGPLHVGHGRGAAVGAALCNLLQAAGYEVVREYYINDAGRQVRLLAESVFARYMELMGKPYAFPEEGYRGDYIIDAARAIAEVEGGRLAAPEFSGEALEFFTERSLGMMLMQIRAVLGEFGVGFDTWQSERELYASGAVAHAIEFLRQRDYVYDHEGAVWFRATAFGDEKDRVIVKSDGEHTYFASDIAYHLKKIEGGFDEIVDIWGADHHGYIPRMEAVIDALGYERSRLKVLLVQMVSLERGGTPVQMSKRAGDFVTLKEIIDEVGSDTTKFIFLTRRPDSHLVFDLEAAKAASAENPVYYVQYANARINSIFRHAADRGMALDTPEEAGATLAGADLGLLKEEEELRLIKKLLAYPMAFEAAAMSREPHRLTFYLQELAGIFHPYYNTHRVVTEDDALTLARLALCRATGRVIRDALATLGVTAPGKM